ncbi:interaptin-like [Penaeus chinensis]|uniref:interaptin-like n=1 Tax=Penaeus chinensis TaxID=139456 RepID=UPI001FB5BC47|nr:interaptin-like [Penaeus chinensis]
MEEARAVPKNEEIETGKYTALEVVKPETIKEKTVLKLGININRTGKKEEIKSIKEEIAEAEEKENERKKLLKGEGPTVVDDYVKLMVEDVRMMEEEMKEMEEKMELIESAIEEKEKTSEVKESVNQMEDLKNYTENRTTDSVIQGDSEEMDEAARLLQEVDNLIKVVESGVLVPDKISEDMTEAGRILEEIEKTGCHKDIGELKLNDFAVKDVKQVAEDNWDTQNEIAETEQEKLDMSYEILEIEDALESVGGDVGNERSTAKLSEDKTAAGTSDKMVDEALINTNMEKAQITVLTENVNELKHMAYEEGIKRISEIVEGEANGGQETIEDHSVEDDEEWEDAFESLKYSELEKTPSLGVDMVPEVMEDLVKKDWGTSLAENTDTNLVESLAKQGVDEKEDRLEGEDEIEESIVYTTATDETVQNTESDISLESEYQEIKEFEEKEETELKTEVNVPEEVVNWEVQERLAQLAPQAAENNISEEPTELLTNNLKKEDHEDHIDRNAEDEDELSDHAVEEQIEEGYLNMAEASQGELVKDAKLESSMKEDTDEELSESDNSEAEEDIRYELMAGRSDDLIVEREKEMFKNMIWSVIMEEPEHEVMEEDKNKKAEKQDETEDRTTILANELFERLIQEKEVDLLRNVRAAAVSMETDEEKEGKLAKEKKDYMADVDLNDEQSSAQETNEDWTTPEDADMELLMKDMENKTHGYENETRKDDSTSGESFDASSHKEADLAKSNSKSVKEAIAKAKEEDTKKKQESLVKSLEAMVKMKQEKKEMTEKEVKSVLDSVLRFLRYLFCCWSIEDPVHQLPTAYFLNECLTAVFGKCQCNRFIAVNECDLWPVVNDGKSDSFMKIPKYQNAMNMNNELFHVHIKSNIMSKEKIPIVLAANVQLQTTLSFNESKSEDT